ncbi:unnamed protein product [Pseudo-nitzschia multistriata]|uniref:Cytochrome b5 heme-binding domain-containing protein n=1 Tax=Pseudo-nitzschia multistriata TaxID=183589 RepID=A0A448ZLU2_9STRA|nr:unnamed protein product [Pseudo-nitzschia multistriata]
MVNIIAPYEEEDETSGNKPSASLSGTSKPSTLPAESKRRSKKEAVFNGRTQGPKFGLLQWQRLVRSRKPNTNFRKDIPWEEISRHNKVHDGWMVLNGIVYDIGPYLPYHPGGIEIFTKTNLLGADGTKAFAKHHPWVSIEGFIGTLAIGTVAADIPPSLEEDEENSHSDGG